MFLDGVAPYALEPTAKATFLLRQLQELLAHHSARCLPYANLVEDWRRHCGRGEGGLEDYPCLPVTVFKEYDLRSTAEAGMRLESSATTSGTASKIFVDKATRKRQSVSANKVLSDFIGPQKRPYVVFDLEATVRGTASLGARGAAILSLAHHASKFYFVGHEVAGQLRLDLDALHQALTEIGSQAFVAYGFTYILYQMHQQLQEHGYTPPPVHPEAVFLHSGGWKRLTDLAVDKTSFNRTIAAVWRISPQHIIDFYGAVEQIGMLYPDCAAGRKHVPYWAEIIVRQPDSLAPTGVGQTGLLQLLNCLPLSAPNHSVLTEDLGVIEILDGCACGRRGKAFMFRGRAPRAELRGCSDVARR
jgi:Acyl-protein synthetase, LuxE